MRSRCRLHRPEAGETLIELLVTIAIMSLGVLAVLGGVLAAVGASSLHRNQINAINSLRGAAELVSRAESADSTPCATAAQVASGAGLTTSGSNVAYVKTVACPTSGLEQVTLQIDVPDGLMPGFSQTLAVVVRKP